MVKQKHEIVISIDGREFSGWDALAVNRSVDALCGDFQFGLHEDKDTYGLGPGMVCKIYVDSELLSTGYVEKRTRSVDGAGASLVFSGREKTCDLIDCTAVYKSGVWKGKVNAITILNNLCEQYGIKAESHLSLVSSLQIANFSLDDGETIFSALDRLCRLLNVQPLTSAEGNIYLTKLGLEIADDSIEYGLNIIDTSENIDFSERFSDYEVKGTKTTPGGQQWITNDQRAFEAGTQTFRGVAVDEKMRNIGRYRKLVDHSSAQSSSAGAKLEAQWQANRRAGSSFSISATLGSWKQSSGKLWVPNNRVGYKNSRWGIEEEYIISSVRYTKDETAGTLAGVTLVDPLTYSREPVTVKTAKGKTSKDSYIKWISNDQRKKTVTTYTAPDGSTREFVSTEN